MKLHFPKQEKDYKEISRLIRSNKIFKPFVVSKSKDRRTLELDFQNPSIETMLKPILLETIVNLGFHAQEITE